MRRLINYKTEENNAFEYLRDTNFAQFISRKNYYVLNNYYQKMMAEVIGLRQFSLK